jgi:hypothetical protein
MSSCRFDNLSVSLMVVVSSVTLACNGRGLPKAEDLVQKFNRITAVEPCTNVS